MTSWWIKGCLVARIATLLPLPMAQHTRAPRRARTLQVLPHSLCFAFTIKQSDHECIVLRDAAPRLATNGREIHAACRRLPAVSCKYIDGIDGTDSTDGAAQAGSQQTLYLQYDSEVHGSWLLPVVDQLQRSLTHGDEVVVLRRLLAEFTHTPVAATPVQRQVATFFEDFCWRPAQDTDTHCVALHRPFLMAWYDRACAREAIARCFLQVPIARIPQHVTIVVCADAAQSLRQWAEMLRAVPTVATDAASHRDHTRASSCLFRVLTWDAFVADPRPYVRTERGNVDVLVVDGIPASVPPHIHPWMQAPRSTILIAPGVLELVSADRGHMFVRLLQLFHEPIAVQHGSSHKEPSDAHRQSPSPRLLWGTTLCSPDKPLPRRKLQQALADSVSVDVVPRALCAQNDASTPRKAHLIRVPMSVPHTFGYLRYVATTTSMRGDDPRTKARPKLNWLMKKLQQAPHLLPVLLVHTAPATAATYLRHHSNTRVVVWSPAAPSAAMGTSTAMVVVVSPDHLPWLHKHRTESTATHAVLRAVVWATPASDAWRLEQSNDLNGACGGDDMEVFTLVLTFPKPSRFDPTQRLPHTDTWLGTMFPATSKSNKDASGATTARGTSVRQRMKALVDQQGNQTMEERAFAAVRRAQGQARTHAQWLLEWSVTSPSTPTTSRPHRDTRGDAAVHAAGTKGTAMSSSTPVAGASRTGAPLQTPSGGGAAAAASHSINVADVKRRCAPTWWSWLPPQLTTKSAWSRCATKAVRTSLQAHPVSPDATAATIAQDPAFLAALRARMDAVAAGIRAKRK